MDCLFGFYPKQPARRRLQTQEPPRPDVRDAANVRGRPGAARSGLTDTQGHLPSFNCLRHRRVLLQSRQHQRPRAPH